MNRHAFPLHPTLRGQDINVLGAPPKSSGEQADCERMQPFQMIGQRELSLINSVYYFAQTSLPCRCVSVSCPSATHSKDASAKLPSRQRTLRPP